MTKADRIRSLYAEGRYTTGEIADLVGCLASYVRVCARQRVDGLSVIDRKYRSKIESQTGEPYSQHYNRKRMRAMSAYYVVQRRLLRMGHSRDFANQKARAAYSVARQTHQS